MKKIALMMLVAIAAIACETTPEVVPELEVTTTELTIPVEGSETFAIEFNASMDWTAKIKGTADWCSISPAKGVAGAGKITVVADPNTVEEERTATIEITLGGKIFEVVITQEALFVPRFTIESELLIPTAGGTVDFAVATNLEYEVTVDENDWLTFNKAADKVTFTATENTATDARTVTATFTTEYPELGGTLTITQDGLCRTLWAIDMETVMNRPAQAAMFSTDSRPTAVSIAVYDGNVVVCAGDGSEPVILDKVTGEKKGTIATGDFKPYTVKQDDAGNLVMSNRLWNRWTAYGNWFRIAYLAPGSSDLKDIAKDVDDEYIGLSMNVRGDVTKDAVIALPKNNGDYVNSVITLYSVSSGASLPGVQLTLGADFKGVTWAGAAFGALLHNHPGLGLLGNTVADGAITACYDANLLQQIDLTTGAATNLTETPLAGDYAGNFAPTGIDIREINGKQYMAVALSCFYASTPPTVYLFDVETKEALYAWSDVAQFNAQDGATTNYEYVYASVTLEPADGGVVVYLADKSSGVIAARYFKL